MISIMFYEIFLAKITKLSTECTNSTSMKPNDSSLSRLLELVVDADPVSQNILYLDGETICANS